MSDQMHYLSMIRSSDALRMPSIVSSQSPASDKSSHSKSIPKQYSSLNVPMPSDVHSNPEILLSWESLNYTVNQKRRDIQVLQNVSGFANPKELLVIMGSSGSGKSTLLNVLAKRVDKGNNIKLSGNVKANGYDVNGFKYREYVGYVTQDDILMETLTPRETLDFAANLRLSSNQKYNNLRIKKLIKQLSLSKVQNKPIGNPLKKIISGGERKRVAIAYELITDPSILFLDEPTSGLDSYTADLLMQILVNQARRGHTIICTLHQPSFNMYQNFDRLILMIQGFIVYQAPAKYAVKYFKNIGFEAPKLINPPDYFMKIVHIKNRLSLTPEEQANLDLFKDTYNINQDFVSSFKASINLGDQLAALESESTIYRPTYLTQLKYTFIRAMKNAERNRVLTRVVIFQTVFLIILLDLIFNNLSTDYEAIVLMIMNQIGISIGMIGGTIFGTPKSALAFGPYLISPLILFGGMFVNIDSIVVPFNFLVYLSPFHYAFEALTVNEYTDQDLDCNCDPIDNLSHNADMLGWDILILICMAIILRLIAYYSLKYKTYKYLQ